MSDRARVEQRDQWDHIRFKPTYKSDLFPLSARQQRDSVMSSIISLSKRCTVPERIPTTAAIGVPALASLSLSTTTHRDHLRDSCIEPTTAPASRRKQVHPRCTQYAVVMVAFLGRWIMVMASSLPREPAKAPPSRDDSVMIGANRRFLWARVQTGNLLLMAMHRYYPPSPSSSSLQ